MFVATQHQEDSKEPAFEFTSALNRCASPASGPTVRHHASWFCWASSVPLCRLLHVRR